MKKIMMVIVAGLISNVAVADSSDPLGTGAANSDPAGFYMDRGAIGDVARVDTADPLGTGAAHSDPVWSEEISSSVSEPQIGDSVSDDDLFDLYETSDLL